MEAQDHEDVFCNANMNAQIASNFYSVMGKTEYNKPFWKTVFKTKLTYQAGVVLRKPDTLLATRSPETSVRCKSPGWYLGVW